MVHQRDFSIFVSTDIVDSPAIEPQELQRFDLELEVRFTREWYRLLENRVGILDQFDDSSDVRNVDAEMWVHFLSAWSLVVVHSAVFSYRHQPIRHVSSTMVR